jgi:hypothetical protein
MRQSERAGQRKTIKSVMLLNIADESVAAALFTHFPGTSKSQYDRIGLRRQRLSMKDTRELFDRAT